MTDKRSEMDADGLTNDEIRDEARAILSKTIATERGRTWIDRSGVDRCLAFLAVLSEDHEWDFLISDWED